jgi:hypothetical protein
MSARRQQKARQHEQPAGKRGQSAAGDDSANRIAQFWKRRRLVIQDDEEDGLPVPRLSARSEGSKGFSQIFGAEFSQAAGVRFMVNA